MAVMVLYVKIAHKDGLPVILEEKDVVYAQLANKLFLMHHQLVKIAVLVKLDKIAKNVEKVRIEKVMI